MGKRLGGEEGRSGGEGAAGGSTCLGDDVEAAGEVGLGRGLVDDPKEGGPAQVRERRTGRDVMG